MKEKGRYYLFFAGIHHPGDRWEMVHPGSPGPGFEYWAGVAYSDTPMGPFRKDERGRIVFGGHLTTFDGPDCRPWYAFRGERPDPQTERLLNIRPDRSGRLTGFARKAQKHRGPVAAVGTRCFCEDFQLSARERWRYSLGVQPTSLLNFR